MIPTPTAVDVPLRTDEHGTIRIGKTRVTLQSVIHAFQRNESPEEIVEGFPVLELGDVYAVIAYYLGHRQEVDEYIKQEMAIAEETRREYEKQYPPKVTRQMLLARLEEKGRKQE